VATLQLKKVLLEFVVWFASKSSKDHILLCWRVTESGGAVARMSKYEGMEASSKMLKSAFDFNRFCIASKSIGRISSFCLGRLLELLNESSIGSYGMEMRTVQPKDKVSREMICPKKMRRGGLGLKRIEEWN
jgi:hypothetical protein